MIFYFAVFTTGVAVGTVATLWLLSLPREEDVPDDALRASQRILHEHWIGELRR